VELLKSLQLSASNEIGRGAVDESLRRMDKLCLELGRASIYQVLPAAIVPLQRAMEAWLNELNYAQQLNAKIQQALTSANDRFERVRLSTLASQVDIRAVNARKLATHTLIALGRECVRQGVVPEHQRSAAETIRELEKQSLGRDAAANTGGNQHVR
jgi:hypothetical protein